MLPRVMTLLLATIATCFAGAAQVTPTLLQTGDPAPALAVGKWVKGDPVDAFQPGKLYVVEFWATWCGPCLQSIPHLTALQKQYAGKVTFIGVSTWESDPSLVEPFVRRQASNMDYTVAMDRIPEGKTGRDGVMASTWMRAAGQDGIPTAFVIDGGGKIAWIGHPMELEGPISKIVAGQWDASAFRKSQAALMLKRQKMAGLRDQLDQARRSKDYAAIDRIGRQMNKLEPPLGYSAILTSYIEWKDYPGALKQLDAMLMDRKYAQLGATWKLSLLLIDMKQPERAYAYARGLLKGMAKDNDGFLNAIAWMIVDPSSKIEKPDLDLAFKAATRSVELKRDSNNLDTLARVYWLRGDKAKAIELEQEAVSHAPTDIRAELEKTLADYNRG